ncbi:unnamed protein product, partial [marine sediment metagenome]
LVVEWRKIKDGTTSACNGRGQLVSGRPRVDEG